MDTSAAVRSVRERLGSEAEARTLVAHVLDVAPSRLVLSPGLDAAAMATLDGLVSRRAAGEPLQHLTGVAHFRTVTVAVGPGVFVPRPETESMVGWCLDHVRAGDRVVELCSGSGVVSLAMAAESPGLEQWAVELSPDAVGYLLRNLSGSGVAAVEADMAVALPHLDGTVDLAEALAEAGLTTTFAALAPSHRKEFVRWVSEAKREQTRADRVSRTLVMVGAGLSRP